MRTSLRRRATSAPSSQPLSILRRSQLHKRRRMFFETLEGRAMMAVDAINDSGTVSENAILATVAPGATASLLANDVGSPITVSGFQAVSAQGAVVNVNTNGTFTYNPTAAPNLQRLGAGQSVVDTFTYTARDNVFNANGLMRVQLAATQTTNPGNVTGNWLNIWNALDGGAGPTGSVAGFNVIANMSDTEMRFDYAGPGSFGAGSTLGLNSINNNGPGGAGGFGGPADDQNTSDYSIRGRTYLRFNTGGTYTIGMGSDDGRRISLTPAFTGSAPGYTGFTARGDQVNGAFNPGDTVIGFDGGTGHAWSVGTFDVNAGDILFLDAFYYEGGGGDSGEIAIAAGAHGNFNGAFGILAQGVQNIDLSSTLFNEDTAVVSVTVTGVNEAPVAVANAYAANEDAVLSVTGPIQTPGIFLETYRAGSINDTMPTADAARAALSPVATATVLLADITDPEGHFPAGNFNNNQPFPGDTVGADDNNYAVFYTGFLQVVTPGTYTFGSSSDDNSRIRIDLDQDGVLEGALGALGGTEAHPGGGTVTWQPGCCGNVFGNPVTLAAGFYRYEMVYTEGGGGSSGEFFYAPGSHTSFNATFRLVGDASAGIASFAVISNLGVLGNDTDEEVNNGSVTQFLAVNQVNGGPLTGTSTLGAVVTMSANGAFTYNPTAAPQLQALAFGQTVVDTFTYRVTDNDPNGALTATATVSITVTGRNDVPIANNNSYTTNENTTLAGTDQDAAPRNQQGDTTPGNANDDGVLVNDIEVDNSNVVEVISTRTILGPGMNVAVYNQQGGENINGTFDQADLYRRTRAANFSGTVALADIIGQPGGHFTNDTSLPGTANDTENYAVYLSGLLRVTTAGTYTFGTFSDDNSRIRIDFNRNGNVNDDGNVATQGGCCGDVFGQATLAVGDYPFEAMYTEGGGGDYGEFFYAPGAHTSFNAAFRLIGDGSAGISSLRYSDNVLNGSRGVLGNGSVAITSAMGAAVTMNDNGTFTYNPSAAPQLQALAVGQTAVDSFSYTSTDNAFTPNGMMGVQLLAATGTLPGNSTGNWLNIWNSVDNGATTGTIAGFNISTNLSDTELLFDYAGPGNFGSTRGLNSINNNGPGGSGGFGGPADDQNSSDYSVRTRTTLRFNTAGTYTIGMGSDDGRRINLTPAYAGSAPGYTGFTARGDQVNGSFAAGDTVIGFDGGTGHAWSVGTFTVAAGDILSLDAFYYEGGGGDSGEIVIAAGAQGTFNASFAILAQGVQNIDLSSLPVSRPTATVNITVTGVNDNPIAVNDGPYTTNENTSLVVTAGNVPGMFLQTYRAGSITDQMATADNARATLQPVATATVLLADITDPEGHFPAGNFNNNQPFPGDTVGADDNNYAVFFTGFLQVITPGTYTFGSSSDDNSRIRIDLDQDGVLEGALLAQGGTEAHPGGGTVMWQPGCCGNVFGAPVTLAAGFYKYEMVYTEGGGGSSGEFFYAPGSHTGMNAAFRLIGDSSQGIASFAFRNGLMVNDFDIDVGDTLTVNSTTIISANGATITPTANGSFTYNPATSQAAQLLINGQTLVDTFVYTLQDNNGGTATATVTVNVTGISDPVNDFYGVIEDNPGNGIDLTVPAGTGVLANDALPGNPPFEVVRANSTNLSGTIGVSGDGSATVATTAGGTVTINDNGSFTYDQLGVFNSLPQGQMATDSFTYIVGGATGAPVVTTQSSAGTFPVSNTDLLEGLTPIVTGTALGGQEGTSSNPAVLSNGMFGPAGLPDAAALAQTLSISNNTTLTYTLDTVANPLGYDISRIDIYSAWRDAGRDNIDVTVQYSTVAAPGTFVDFTGPISFAPGTPPSGQASITPTGPAGFLQNGVAAIRFVFGNQENGYVGYRELDVIGAPRTVQTVTFNITGQNDAPTANANGPYNINLGQNLAVSAAGSADVDTGTVLTYGWDLNLDNTIDFSTTSQNATIPWSTLQSLTPPMGAGSYTIRLNVFDGFVTTQATATLNISDNFVYNPTQDGVADGYLLILNPAQTIIEIRDTATNTLITSAPKAGTNQVTFNGTNDNDTLTIDWTNTTPIPALNGVTFSGGAGTNGLVLRNGTVTTVTENFVTDNNGSTNIDGRVVNYTGLTPITDTLTAANRIFNFTAGNETVTLQNAAGTTLLIDSTLGAATTFNRPTDSLTANMLTGSVDTFNITSATLTGNFTVAGSDGNDTVNVNGAVAVTAGATLPGLVSATAGTINLSGGSITTVNNVNLAASGAITTSSTAVDINAVNLISSASTSIDLDTNVASIAATVSGAGGTITLDETNGVTLQNVTTNNGAITFRTTAAGNVVVENVNSGTQATSITLSDGDLTSGAADPGVADVVAGNLTITINTGANFIGTSAANRFEIDVDQLKANIVGGTNNSAWIVNTAGNLTMNDSSMAATGVTVFDVLVQNGNLLSIVDGLGDARAIQVILAVTGATSTIGASAAAPFEINSPSASAGARVDATTPGGAANHIFIRDVADSLPVGTINAGAADVFLDANPPSGTTASIIDNANDAVIDVIAGRLVMTSESAGGIGVTNGTIDTQVGSLEATAGSLGVFVSNTGNLIIGGISAAVGVSATGGGIIVSSAGSITVNENVTGTGVAGGVILTATDAAAAGQDISVGAGVTISSALQPVTLNAGDNATLTATSTISAPNAAITINIDSGNLDAAGGTLTIPSGAVLTAFLGATFNGANPGAATDADTFTFAPQVSTPIVVNGFNPSLTPTGDTLNLSLAGTTGTTLTIDGVNDGIYSFTNRASVEYNSIEDVNAVSGSYDLVLDMTGFGIPGNFTVRRSAPAVGTDLVIVNNTTATTVFTGDIALITSLRVSGTTGADSLTVDDVNGMVSFDPLLTPTFVFPDNPNGAGTPRLLFNGAAGADSLNFQLTEAGTAQVYAIGSGAGPAAGDGEIATTNTAGRNLVTYFTNLGNDGSQVNRTGAAAGSLTVLGDAANNTINVQPNGTETRVDPLTYTPFDFSGNNYNNLIVTSVAGADLIDLLGLGTAQTNNMPITFDGGTQDDTLRVRSTSGQTGVVTLVGNTGNDLFQLFDTAPTVDGITAQVVVDGSDGSVSGNTDTLVINDRADATADTVLIAAVAPGSSQDYGLDGINTVGVTDVIFRNIDALDYTGTSANDVIDTRLVNTSPQHDLSTVTVNGWLGADQFLLFTSDQAGGSGPGVTPTGVPSGVATVNLNGDAPGNPNGADGNDVFGQTAPGITGTGSGNVGLTVPDTVRGIRPSVTTGINIDGGQPTGPALPTQDTVGDVLNLDVSGLPGGSALILPTLNGTVATTGFQPLNFTQIEDINLIINNQLINVQMGDVFVRGTAGQDLIQFMRAATTANPNRTRTRVNTLVVDYTLTGKTVTYAGGADDYITQSNVTRPMEAYGEDGDDYISGAVGNDFLVGGLGSDQINAAAGDNIVWGDNAATAADPTPQDLAIGGLDTLSALGGNDVFYGGGGDDSVSAGGGNDYAYGGQGDDTLGGNAGDDRLYGGLGNDNISGGAGNDMLTGGGGDDQLIGETGNDVLFGGTGADTIGGSEGNDLIVSGSVANENSSFTSLPNTSTYNAVTYSSPTDNDAALLTLLANWGGSSSRAGLGAITHDGQDDDLFGFTGDDDFCWETIDILDDFPAISPADYNGFGMGTDERFGPTA